MEHYVLGPHSSFKSATVVDRISGDVVATVRSGRIYFNDISVSFKEVEALLKFWKIIPR